MELYSTVIEIIELLEKEHHIGEDAPIDRADEIIATFERIVSERLA
jgi:hypothetical protein